MKIHLSTGNFQHAAVILLVCSISLLVATSSVLALTGNHIDQCYDCHGSSSDIRPLDATYRNISTGAFVGNHRTHIQTATTDVNTCAECHGTSPTVMNHRDGKISFPININTSRVNGQYNGGAIFVNQTSLPTRYTCTNINCHFETVTPQWGQPTASVWSTNKTSNDNNVNCAKCHLTTGLATGKHTKHISADGGTQTTCAKCHPNYNSLAAAAAFSHATTGKGPITVTFTTLPNLGGQYTGGRTGNNFLPGAGVAATGTCSSIYCHSSGNVNNAGTVVGPTTYKSPAWNATEVGCAACHGDGLTGGKAHPVYTSGAAASNTANSHVKHVESSLFSCDFCHNTTTTSTTIPPTTVLNGGAHLNKIDDVSFKTNGGKTGTYTTAAKTCTNTYCHGVAASPAWGAATTCVSCHDATSTGLTLAHAKHYNSTTAPTVLAGGVDTHTTTSYAYSCLACHPSNQHSTGPASAIAPLQDAAVTGTKISAYVKGAAAVVDGKGFNYTTSGTCTSVCHTKDGITAGSAVIAQNWGTTATGTCGVCHSRAGDVAPTWSTPHTKHINTYAANTNITCGSCHTGTAANNTALQATVQARTQHPNANKDLAMNAFASGTVSGAQGAQQCTNTYCHSQGTSFTAPTHAAVSWSGVTVCNSCHTGGTTGSTQGPTYASGTPKANSHPKHAYTCDFCHSTVTNAAGTIINPALHVSKAYNLAQGGTATFTVTVNGTPTTPTQCSSISCHGGASATWGATLNCQDCHGNGATASVADFGATFWNNGTVSKFQMTGTGSWAGNGHGLATGTYGGSGNPAANFAIQAKQCEYCHDSTIGHNTSTNAFRLLNYSTASYGRNAPCLVCHATAGAGITVNATLKKRTTSKAIEADHYGSKHSAALNGGQFCWDCHDPHGTGTTNQYMIRSKPAQVSNRSTGEPTTQTATAVVFTLSATPTGTDYAKSAAPFNGICNVCHTTTSHYTQTAGDAHNSTARCTSCHGHTGSIHGSDAFKPTGGHTIPYDTHKAAIIAAGGNSTCLGCHAMGTAASVYPAAVAGNAPDCMSCHKKAAPLHTGTTAGANCSSCHGLSTATTTKIGRPVGTAYPDRLGYHSGASDGAHGTAACTVCHNGAGTTSGNNSGINHGKGSTAGPVRNGKPNVVGPMVTGITPTNSAKGVGTAANGTTCNHNSISGCSGGGTQTNKW